MAHRPELCRKSIEENTLSLASTGHNGANEHSPVILIATITSRKTDRVYPFEVWIDSPEGGLRVTSKVLLMRLRSVDNRRFYGITGVVSDATMLRVDAALKVATGLTKL